MSFVMKDNVNFFQHLIPTEKAHLQISLNYLRWQNEEDDGHHSHLTCFMIE